MAQEQGWQLGKEVGWQVRFDAAFTKETGLIYLTPGLFLQRLQADPLLEGS